MSVTPMRFIVSREAAGYWQKKGALSVVLEEGGKDGIIFERAGRPTLTFDIKKRKDITWRKLILLARRFVREAIAKRYATIVCDLSVWRFPHLAMSDEELGELLAVNFEMANFSFTDFLTRPKEGFPAVHTVVFVNARGRVLRRAFERGNIIGEEVNRARHIATMPGGVMTPELLVRHTEQVVKGLPIRLTVLNEVTMRKLKMGGIVGVGQGSDAKPRFLILEYFGAPQKKEKPARNAARTMTGKPVVLVGKGVTFDTGGINLKPTDALAAMNMDMSGGAAVIHTLAAAARLQIRKNIVALVPAVENMPSGTSYRPGDVLRSMSGKTIQVDNTDAEGRIILADALTYAKRYHPSLVIDVATLTGAAMVALGERATALFTQDESLEKTFRVLGEESGDYVWPLPLWDEYDADIKGTFGDWSNTGTTRWGGAITAAAFLKQFVDRAYPWVHLDIAPRMTTLADEYLAKGAAGAPVRLLIRYLEHSA